VHTQHAKQNTTRHQPGANLNPVCTAHQEARKLANRPENRAKTAGQLCCVLQT
jgi:hypothetical protein